MQGLGIRRYPRRPKGHLGIGRAECRCSFSQSASAALAQMIDGDLSDRNIADQILEWWGIAATPDDLAEIAALAPSVALGAYGYGLARYGTTPKAAVVAVQSLSAGKLCHALVCRSETQGLFGPDRPSSNPYLPIALGGSLSVQVLSCLVPGLRRLFGVPAMGYLDIVVVGLSAFLATLLNGELKRENRRTESSPEGRGFQEATRATA